MTTTSHQRTHPTPTAGPTTYSVDHHHLPLPGLIIFFLLIDGLREGLRRFSRGFTRNKLRSGCW